jgi:hypothetical protein
MIETTSAPPTWASLVAPAFYTLFGAGLGFGFGRLTDWLDNRQAKTAFLKAIRVELLTIRGHLEGTLKDATTVEELIKKGGRQVLHLATAFQTAVYDSQLGKLKDVSDPLVIEVIQFYAKLSNVERVKSHSTSLSFDLRRLADTKEDAVKEGPIVGFYLSSLQEVIARIRDLIQAVDGLISKLPRYAS